MPPTTRSTMRNKKRPTPSAERRTPNAAASVSNSAFDIRCSTFGVCFISFSSTILPIRLRGRTRFAVALLCVNGVRLRGWRCSSGCCNKRSLFSPATTSPETAATMCSNDLHSTISPRERGRARSPHSGEHPPKLRYHPRHASDRRSPVPKAGLVIARRSCRENKSPIPHREEAKTLQE